MRCCALASALRDTGASSLFICAALPADMETMLSREQITVERIPSAVLAPANPFGIDQVADSGFVLRSLQERTLDWMVVDHYGIGAEWERRVRAAAARIAVIDDLANRRHDADLLVDPNLQGLPDSYAELLPQNCRQLLGTRFALLRPDFAALRARSITHRAGQGQNVVVFAGGGDPQNATERVLDAWSLLGSPRPSLDVVVGSSHPCYEELRRKCRQLGDVTLHVETNRMAELIARAQLLIGSAGGVSWERCCLGVPALMFSIAPNQDSNLRLLARLRTGLSLGPATLLDPRGLSALLKRVLDRPRLLRRMGRRAAALVDGQGTGRVALAMQGDAVSLRAALPEDSLLAWPWRNDPATRRFFRDSRALTIEEHSAWWARSMLDGDRRLFFAQCARRDIGVVRFDIRGETAEVSIYLDPAFVGLGLGAATLRAAQTWAREGVLKRLEAHILSGNQASRAAFEAVGFRLQGSVWEWETGK